ncbi:MAG TPA: Fic family protein [Phycisphaerae bacterium]
MNPAEFTDSKAGRLIRSGADYWAFVPNPLPPNIDLDWPLASRLTDAMIALGELAGLTRNLPNSHLLMGPFARREAVLSSRIEGTQAALPDLVLFEGAQVEQPTAPDVREVSNYVRALEHGLARLSDLPLSLRLIREMHAILMEGVRGGHATPGEFRRSQNWIGWPGSTLATATYVPPPVPEMLDALNDLENYLDAAGDYPPLVRMAVAHYQFEAIHPFVDGNGRIGRLLISLLLCQDQLLPQPVLYLSAFFEHHCQRYYELLLGVSREGKWKEWLDYFLTGVAEQSRDAIWRAGKLLDLWREYREWLAKNRSAGLLMQLIDALFEMPVITIPRAAKLLGITHRAATLNVDKLVAAGILTEVTGRERNRAFMARRIVEIADDPAGAARAQKPAEVGHDRR